MHPEFVISNSMICIFQKYNANNEDGKGVFNRGLYSNPSKAADKKLQKNVGQNDLELETAKDVSIMLNKRMVSIVLSLSKN